MKMKMMNTKQVFCFIYTKMVRLIGTISFNLITLRGRIVVKTDDEYVVCVYDVSR